MAEAKLLEPDKCQAMVAGSVGLSSDEAHRRLAEFGPNTVSEDVPPRWRLLGEILVADPVGA